MKLILNRDYDYLRDYLTDIDFHFENEGEVIHQGRNRIAICRVDGLELNIKRYGRPSFLKRIIYSFFRSPKGLRAYLYPMKLLERGIETPVPVAYIEKRKWGLITDSYFVSIQSPYSRRMYEFGDRHVTGDHEAMEIVKAFARFTARVHKAGVEHLDYSPGNILFDKVDGEWRFSLVDTNRMYFGEVDPERGCRNFARLWGQIDFFHLLADEYAAARDADRVLCRRWVMEARDRFWKRFSRRHKVKYNLNYE